MPDALCLIQDAPHYRRDAIEAGLSACGYRVTMASPVIGSGRIIRPKPEDVLTIWNRYGLSAILADQYEAAGATVIVAENGIIGATENAYAKQFARNGEQLYVLSLDYHNGAGRWHVGARGRWREQGIEVKPWRQDGEHILVLPQRGFGHPKVAPPRDWLERTVKWLKARTYRELRIRQHPGNAPAKKPLDDDLRDCRCCVTWGSGAGVKALCAGVPVYSDWPLWIGCPAALPLDRIGLDIEPSDVLRETMLDRLAWLQWSVPEIARGEPFRRLLAVQSQRAAA